MNAASDRRGACGAVRRIVLCGLLVSGASHWASACLAAKPGSGLQSALAQVRSVDAKRRIAGFERLREIWALPRPAAAGGFSDTPVARTPRGARTQPSATPPQLADADVDLIAGAIEVGLADPDAEVRKAASIALMDAPRSRPSVVSAVVVAIKSPDSSPIWYLHQHKEPILPPLADVIDPLLAKIAADDWNCSHAAEELLREYGKQADPYADRLVDLALNSLADRADPKRQRDDRRSHKLSILGSITMTETVAEKLLGAAARYARDELEYVTLDLLERPAALKRLIATRPDTISALESWPTVLYSHLCVSQTKPSELRELLLAAPQLRPFTMGLLRDKRFLDKIAAEEARAPDSYDKAMFAAFKRACGGELGTQLAVDNEHPVTFRPASAWPETDERRMFPMTTGHGDGFTTIFCTGEVRRADGTHPEHVEFFRINDAMLLGTEVKHRTGVLYDAPTGRFVFVQMVFAAYARGEGKREPGPYQTGSAQIRIEAQDCLPLTIQFFDEMPDIVVTLEKK